MTAPFPTCEFPYDWCSGPILISHNFGSGWIVQGPAYNHTLPESENPTHGSVWIVQIQPTTETPLPETENPTHGSVWIVQIQPTSDSPSGTDNPTHGSV